MKASRFGLCLVSFCFNAAAFGAAPAALTPGVTEEVLSECYVATTPALRQSVTGVPGDSRDTNNPCYDGQYASQNLSYVYQVKRQVLLIIANDCGQATTQTVTKVAPATMTFSQQIKCQTREQFAADALAYFNLAYGNLQAVACQ